MEVKYRNYKMFYRIIQWGIIFPLLHWLLYSCATPTAPQGGPRDETPPMIVEAESTPNMQTNFQKQTIELTFDEWVTLEKAREEIVISPPLRVDPEYKLKKRTVQVIFADTIDLRENVTYTINFGESVKDLNEKNPAENLRFVFSTGDYIDSLSIRGRVLDIITGLPVEKTLFMLYDNLADSVVRTERPLYFGKTGKDGRFVIENIKEGVYKGFALEDQANSPKKYILETNERLAFPDSLIVVGADSTKELELLLFAQKPPLRLSKVDSVHFGKVTLSFNQPLYDLELAYQDIVDTPLVRMGADSLILWYQQDRPWTLFINQDTFFRDTILIKAGRKAAFMQDAVLKAVGLGGSNQPITPGEPPVIRYNHPLETFDTSLIALYIDTARQMVRPEVRIDSLDRQKLIVDYRWREDVDYELEIQPAAITDIFGLQNPDSLVIRYRLDGLKKYGNIKLALSELDSTQQYLVQLMSKDLKQTVLTDTISGLSTYETVWSIIRPGDYTLRVITDWNKNGRWDTGNYDQQLQPEPIYLRPLEKLRANWDLDADIRYGEVVELAEPEPATQNNNPNNRRPGGRN